MENNKATAPIQKNNKQAKMRIEKKQTKKLSKSNINNPLNQKKMATTNIYLNFNGNCEEAFNFYKSVFGTEFSYIGRFGEMPEDELNKVNDADKNNWYRRLDRPLILQLLPL